MIDILEDWIVDSVPSHEDFFTRPSLMHKVSPEGHFVPYHGITVVFRLKPDVIQYLSFVQDRLYETCGHLLSDRIDVNTFHMTLTDIISGPPYELPEENYLCYGDPLSQAIKEIQADFPNEIPVQGTCLFNMCHTSIVLGVDAESNEEDRLNEMIRRMDVAMGHLAPTEYPPYPYPRWTPHITLAYFKPRGHMEYDSMTRCNIWIPDPYTQEELQPLREALTKEDILFTLRPSDLEVQTFTDMNHYETFK